MRYFLSLLLLITIIAGCSKKNTTVRTNFLEFTVGGKKIEFIIKDTALLYTIPQHSFWNFSIYNNASAGSSLNWVIYSTSKWVNGNYEYPGGYERSINYMTLSTYVNGPMESYYLVNLYHNPFKITIDQSDNGRIHGTFSGTMTCGSCGVPDTVVKITGGEFEMPYILY